MNVAPIHADRARWHCLFPEGVKERYPHPTLAGKVLETKYTSAVLQKMVAAFRAYIDASQAFGMLAKPLPVQLQHAGIKAMQGKLTDTSVSARRLLGGVFDLVYVPRGSGFPPGVYALIEWNAEGWNMIESREYNALSPTTLPYWTLADGSRIAGPFLAEVGLVDVGFFEHIGMVQDCLPLSAIPYTGNRPVLGSTANIPTPALRHYPEDLVLTRGAIYRSIPMDQNGETTATVEAELDPSKLTPEVMEAIVARVIASPTMRAMCREVMDTLATERGYMVRENAPATETEVVDAAASATEDIMTRAKSLELTELQEEALGLVKERRLLAANVPAFIRERQAGNDPSSLIGDYSAIGKLTGVPGTVSREQAPQSAAKVVTVKESDLRKQAMDAIVREKGASAALPHIVHERLVKLRHDAIAAGTQIIDA